MILIESNFNNLVTEQTADSKRLYIKGIFMESERQNRNGRTYKREEIQKAVNKVNEAASNNRHFLGELDHPPELTVKLENVSHKIMEMWMDGNNAVGKALILGTPKGNIAKALIDSDVQFGVSSRGSGSVNESTGIVEGFDLVTVDLVANPSAIDAYPTSVFEALQMYKRGNIVNELADAIRYDSAAQKYFQKEINKFIEELFS